MPSLRDIRRRIKSIKSTQQVTRAMKTVAAAKLRRAQDKVLAARPYARFTREMLGRVTAAAAEAYHPLLEVREVKKTAYLVITADRGLCGGFNANVIRETSRRLPGAEGPVLITVGRKARDFFKRRDYLIEEQYVGLGEDVHYEQAKKIARRLMEIYAEGKADSVYIVFNRFVNTLVQRPTVIKLLPAEPPGRKEDAKPVDYIFEPSPEVVLESLLPRYVETTVFYTLLESKASEHSARMTAMDNATKNAEDMIDMLTLKMNRARQAVITKEISEIVGGAAALEKG